MTGDPGYGGGLMSPWKSCLALVLLFAGSAAAAQPAAEPPAQTAAQNAPPPAPLENTPGALSGEVVKPGEPGAIKSGEPGEPVQPVDLEALDEPGRWNSEAAGHPIENISSRPSGFWTSRRPAKGGAYRYRLLGIGVVLVIATLLFMIRVVRRYERPESP